MKNSLIVFQVSDCFFGIDPQDFESHFMLNSVWVSPSPQHPPLWVFERENDSSKGFFIHFGALVGLSHPQFDDQSTVFMKKVPGNLSLGICLGGFLMKVPRKKTRLSRTEADEFEPFPEVLPRTAFTGVHRYKRRNILVIDPILLFQAYNLLGSI